MNSAASSSLGSMVAMVTGSSSGIGRAIALELAAQGADVWIHARQSQEAAHETSQLIQKQHGRESRVFLADLEQHQAQDRLAEEAWRAANKIDIWINNAGVDLLTGEQAAWPFERKLRALWEVDVTATMRLARDIGRRMLTQGSGTILNIGWDQAELGMEGESGQLFAAAKGAIMSFTKSLAKSLAPTVRVNCLAPGWIKTSWGEKASEAWHARAQGEAQLGRWGTPEDIARTAAFLVSPAASFIHGQIISVNGGYKGFSVPPLSEPDA